MIGWRKLVATTVLATIAAIVFDRIGVTEKVAALIP
jgi:hypothetical protein